MASREHRVLFVCSGNICRSPMAEYIARDRSGRTGVSMDVRSAGTLGLTDRPAEPGMVKVGLEIGLDLSAHRCQPITDELVEWADHILVMEYRHVGHIETEHPASRGRVELLGRQIGIDEIDDPIGAWFSFRYRKARDRIQEAVHRFVDQLPSEVDE